jgi:formylglycine-generating enzyme required for sulfatase activity
MTKPKPDSIAERDMVYVPGGEFQFGPEREIMHVEAFWIDRFPITNSVFREHVAEHRYVEHRAMHPVVWVNWSDAEGYLAALTLRLPSQLQWEKAARGAHGALYPWGDTHDPRRFNVLESAIEQTTAVDAYRNKGTSPYGAEDMAGNVWEWTESIATLSDGVEGRIVCGGAFDQSWFEMQGGVGTFEVRDPSQGYSTVGFRGVYAP